MAAYSVDLRQRVLRAWDSGLDAERVAATYEVSRASVCVTDPSMAGGFYLLTLKGSEQDGLTGVKGSILRQVVVEKTRESLERALASIKRTIERSAPAAEH